MGNRTVCHPVYNDVGFVKSEKSDTSPLRAGSGVEGAVLGRSSWTLEAASGSPIMERGTKRSAVQLSFVP